MQIIALQVMGDSGKSYTVEVDANTGTPTCSCPDHAFRGSVCKHMTFAASQLGLVH